jgi:flavodoxin
VTRKLIIYYSRTGTTRALAAELAIKLDADMLSIEDTRSRRGATGYLRSLFEVVRGTLPAIEPTNLDPSSYDLVLLGTPVWAGRPSSPMRRFLCDVGHSLHHVAFFCTYGGRGFDSAFGEMRELLGKAPIATLAVRQGNLIHHRHEKSVDRFLTKIANVDRWTRLIEPADHAAASHG